jgi:hypothetical protein
VKVLGGVGAMGRRSKLHEWITSFGGCPPHEEASDAGFAYADPFRPRISAMSSGY